MAEHVFGRRRTSLANNGFDLHVDNGVEQRASHFRELPEPTGSAPFICSSVRFCRMIICKLSALPRSWFCILMAMWAASAMAYRKRWWSGGWKPISTRTGKAPTIRLFSIYLGIACISMARLTNIIISFINPTNSTLRPSSPYPVIMMALICNTNIRWKVLSATFVRSSR